jgi:hypothetical protein
MWAFCLPIAVHIRYGVNLMKTEIALKPVRAYNIKERYIMGQYTNNNSERDKIGTIVPTFVFISC